MSERLTDDPKHTRRGRFFGHDILAGCDGRCEKAWGINNRPRHQFSEDPDDYVFLADSVLGAAPADPGTYEGGHAKPGPGDTKLNKWCIRECERSVTAGEGEALRLPDMEHPAPNMPHRRGS